MRFPHELRESLVLSVDDFFEMDNDDPDATTLASAIIQMLLAAAEDIDMEEDDLVGLIEDECELEDPLQQVLEEEFSKNDELELTGEDVVTLVEKLLGIEWTEAGLEGGYEDEDSYDEEEEDDSEED